MPIQHNEQQQPQQDHTPIINAHTHVFKSKDVPSLLAKKMAPLPIAWLINTHQVIAISLWYKKMKDKRYSYTARNKVWQNYLASKSPVYSVIRTIWLTLWNAIFLFYLLYLIKPILTFWPVEGWLAHLYTREWADKLLFFDYRICYLLIILLIFLLFVRIRNWFFKMLWGLIKRRLGKQWVELMLRYVNLINFAGYKGMSGIFSKLKLQYPPNSKFVVLPMDMHFMKAGKTPRCYYKQMSKLLAIKRNNPDIIYPFLFAHPKRMVEVHDDLPYFSGQLNPEGRYELNKCHVKSYFDAGAAGVKIYPATGYYAFDKSLLPLWLYCAQNNIPITTHCSVGPIFFRGNLKSLVKAPKKIDEHPVFTEIIGKNADGSPKEVPLRLPIKKNRVFQRNFTHPLNYLCLLDETLLKKVLVYHNDTALFELFGYDPKKPAAPLARNLSNLKINLAHYGGAENWDQFLEQDRYDYANDLINDPDNGLNLPIKIHNPNVLYKFWHNVDWFSLISSMMINYDHVYTDVSYTSHDLKYLNLLNSILEHPHIATRVLFGTDFYVVSNHKSEKHYWIDMQQLLGPFKWRQLSYENPSAFLGL